MELKDVIEPGLVLSSDESVLHSAIKMSREGKHEALVVDNGEFKGVVSAFDMVKRSVSDPNKVKISYFLKKVKPFTVDSPVEDVINQILVSDFRSLPVKYGQKMFVITKLGLLRFVKPEVFSGKSLKDVMHFPYCVSPGDTLETVKSLMKDLGLSRIPVVGEGGEIIGLVDSLALLRVFEEKRRTRLGERVGERLRKGVSISYFVKRDFLKANPNDDLRGLIRKMVRSNRSVALVEENGKLAGMISLKDIFKLFGQYRENVYIRVSGLKGEDEFIKSLVNKMISNFVRKFVKVIPINYLVISVERYKKSGKRSKYSVHGRLVTGKGNFYVKDSYWDLTKTVKEVLGNLEREVKRKIGKERLYTRGA